MPSHRFSVQLLGTIWASCLHRFMFVINFENLSHYYIKYFSVLFYLFLWYSNYPYAAYFKILSQFLDALFCLYFYSLFFSFTFQFGKFHWTTFKLTHSSLCSLGSIDEPIKSNFVSVSQLFYFSYFLWFFLRVFICLSTLCICSSTLCMFSIRAIRTIVTVIWNFLSYGSTVSVILDSGFMLALFSPTVFPIDY